MKHLLFKFQFVIGIFFLVNMSVQASDDDLITRQITVKLDKAGTLPDRIGEVKMYKITNSKIVGDINGTDVRFIRRMAGNDKIGVPADGVLSILDLSEAEIVKGGYYYNNQGNNYYYTEKNMVGENFFYNCSRLTHIVMPSNVTSIGPCAFEDCTSLTNIEIPSSVTSIGSCAFQGCI